MKSIFVVLLSAAFLCTCALAQGFSPEAGANVMYFQQGPVPMPPPDAQGNVMFRTGGAVDAKADTFFIQAEDGKTITGAPYTATATTESTQSLADGNRIVNKSSSSLARDGQGRTRREEAMSSVGPWKVPAKTLVFINDPVAQSAYVLDVNDKTAQVFPRKKTSATAGAGGGVVGKTALIQGANTNFERKIIVADGPVSITSQHVVVSTMGSGEFSDQAKSESLGTQVMEGVTVVGKRVTRTIPAGQIGNERPIEITSEVWTSPDLKLVVLSKRNDPRIGETVYRLTDIRRAEPDHSTFEVPPGYTIKEAPPLPELPPLPPVPPVPPVAATPSTAPGSPDPL